MLRSESICSLFLRVIVLVSIAGCDFLAEDSVNVTIGTDRTAYSAAPGSEIQLTVTNLAEAPLHFVCEGWVDLEEFRRGRRVKSWKIAGWQQCGVVTLQQGEHAERVYTFDENATLPTVTGAAFSPDVRYRLRFRLFRDRLGHEDPIDREDQYSNEFSIVRTGAFWTGAGQALPPRWASPG